MKKGATIRIKSVTITGTHPIAGFLGNTGRDVLSIGCHVLVISGGKKGFRDMTKLLHYSFGQGFKPYEEYANELR